MATSQSTTTGADGAGYFAVYAEHAKTLRTWLTAYGIGGPVLILGQDKLWNALKDAQLLNDVGALFLLGVALQVTLAAVNKAVMWGCYYGEDEPTYKETTSYKVAEWTSKQYVIDLLVDLASIILFAVATFFCFAALSQ